MAKGKVLFRIDINEDGDFDDAGEDVTADVRSFRLVQGKRVQKHRVEVSVLEFVLKNDTHNYSPSNGSGVWFPFVKLSPVVWFMMGYPVDTFDASNGTDLASRKPDFDDKFAAWTGDTSDFEVDTNKIKATSAANLTAVLDFGEAHCFVGCKVTRTGSNSGVVLRYTDASNFFLIRSDGTTLYLSKVEAGSMTTVASAAHIWTSTEEHWILAETHGDNFRVAIDDTLVLSEINGAVSSFQNTATKHGIGGRATNTADRWDDFGGWRSVFYGRVDVVQPRPFRTRQYAHVRALDDMERLSKHQVYRLAPTAPVWGDDILNEILDGANFSSSNRILLPPDVRDSEQGTVSATGSALFRLDDTTQKFREWLSGEFNIVITDATGTTAKGWIGTSDVDGDGTRIEIFNSSDLDVLGYASSDTGFDETDTPLTYDIIWRPLTEDAASRSALGRDALTEAYQVVDDDVGQFFIDGSGFARYEQYLHRIPPSGHHATSINCWFASRQAGDETDIYFQDMVWDDGKDRVENEAYYRFHKLSTIAAAQVWRLHPDDIPLIKSGEILTVTALGEGDVITDPRVPRPTTDFSFNTAAGGGGTDLLVPLVSESGTSTVGLTEGATFELDDSDAPFIALYRNGKHQVRIIDLTNREAMGYIGTTDVDGDDTKIGIFKDFELTTPGYADEESGFDNTDGPLEWDITNITMELIEGFDGNFRQIRIRNASTSDGFLHFLQLFAQKGSKANESAARAQNSESQTFVGRRRVEITTLHIDKFQTAEQRARGRIGERSIPRERVELTMMNATRANLMQIIHRQMSDQVDLTYTPMGVDGHYVVERRTISMQVGDSLVEATIELTAQDTWLAGSATNQARAGLARAR